MDDHIWFRENIETRLADGLSGEEAARFVAHRSDCDACGARWAEAVEADASFRLLFADAMPRPGFEDRIVDRLELKSRPVLRISPFARRIATGIAATVLLGVLGYLVNGIHDRGGLPSLSLNGNGAPERVAHNSQRTIAHNGIEAQGVSVRTRDSLGAATDRLQIQTGVDDAEIRLLKSWTTWQSVATPALSAAGEGRIYFDATSGTFQFSENGAAYAPLVGAGGGISTLNGQELAATGMNYVGFKAPDAVLSNQIWSNDVDLATAEVSGILTDNKGGTGLDTSLTAAGAILRRNAAGTAWEDLVAGAQNDVLTVSGGVPVWAAPSAGSAFSAITTGTNTTATMTAGTGATLNVSGAGTVQATQFIGTVSMTNDVDLATAGPADMLLTGSLAALSFSMTPDQMALALSEKTLARFGRSAETPQTADPLYIASLVPTLEVTAEEGSKAAKVYKALETRRTEGREIKDRSGDYGSASETNNGASLEIGPEPTEGVYSYRNEAPTSVFMRSKIPYFQPADLKAPAAEPPPKKPAPAKPTRQDRQKKPTPRRQDVPMQTKIIRNGEMEFEVESFDSALLQITKIVREEGGFIATTNSEKLPNGKVRGTVVARVPPGRLDVLVLKLRALGDLKSQRISSQDITKQYTDLESGLRAARAMEERLIQIIKTGKGEIKDLLEAEKQLGTWREKIEKLEGEIRYYNNLVALSTLSITLSEKNIKTPTSASETEHVNMGIETEDVEQAYTKALEAIAGAKGRVTQSELKKYEAGQFAAMIVCEVAPEAAGPLRDRLNQLGRVSRLDIERRQSTAGGTGAPTGVKLERKETRFNISLYNLANVAPRETVNLNLACADVEAAFRANLKRIEEVGGRLLSSNLTSQKANQSTGSIRFEVKIADAEVILNDVRATGEVMQLTVTENPDAKNVTRSKRGFTVQLYALAQVPPRESSTLSIAARSVPEAFRRIQAAVQEARGRILASQLNETDPANISATLDFEVSRPGLAGVQAALATTGEITSRTVQHASDAASTVDSKVRISVGLVDVDRMQARETITLHVASPNVSESFQSLLSAVEEAEGHVIVSRLEEKDRNNVFGLLDFEVRTTDRVTLDQAIANAGDTISRRITRATETQNVLDSKVRIQVSLVNAALLLPRETITVGIEVADVEKSFHELLTLGRTVSSHLSKSRDGQTVGNVVIDVPLSGAMEVRNRIEDMGMVRVIEARKDPRVPGGRLARARIDVTVANADALMPADKGFGSSIRDGLSTSITGLLWSLNLIIIGLCFVGPWALILFGIWRFIKRRRARTAAPA